MAIVVIISGFGALNGWTMICAEMPLAAAKDGLFPDRFKRISRDRGPGLRHHRLHGPGVDRDAPQLPGFERRDGVHDARPHERHHRRDPLRVLGPGPDQVALGGSPHPADPRFVRDLIVAVISLVFSILFISYSRNTGNSFWIYWAPFFLAGAALLLGIPVYNAQRRSMTEPDPVPEYR